MGVCFFFQAEDGIRDLVRSRGLEMCIRDSRQAVVPCAEVDRAGGPQGHREVGVRLRAHNRSIACLLYTSDAADERSSVDLGGRRIIKKKTLITRVRTRAPHRHSNNQHMTERQ